MWNQIHVESFFNCKIRRHSSMRNQFPCRIKSEDQFFLTFCRPIRIILPGEWRLFPVLLCAQYKFWQELGGLWLKPEKRREREEKGLLQTGGLIRVCMFIYFCFRLLNLTNIHSFLTADVFSSMFLNVRCVLFALLKVATFQAQNNRCGKLYLLFFCIVWRPSISIFNTWMSLDWISSTSLSWKLNQTFLHLLGLWTWPACSQHFFF